MSAAQLEIDSLCVGYGSIGVLEDVSLIAEAGKVHCILGANGAGKSTLLRGISGMLRPSRGSVVVDGAQIGGLRPEKIARRGIGHVAEGRRIFRQQSVEINLQLGCQALKLSSAEVRARREAAYDLFPVLREKRTSVAATLSGGQQQMLAIAQAMVRAPRLLMLDEPSLGLSPLLVDEVFEALRTIRDQGCTIVLVEQFIGRALALADHVTVLRTGRVMASGTPDEFDAARLERAYVGTVEAP
jgi:branched-chain amino acid transport system ATP-binding protein